jgi:hypothetical protein
LVVPVPVHLLFERIRDQASNLFFTAVVKIQHVKDEGVVPTCGVFLKLHFNTGHLDLLISLFHREKLSVLRVFIEEESLCSVSAVNAADLKGFLVRVHVLPFDNRFTTYCLELKITFNRH